MYVVADVAGLLRRAKSIPPLPVKVNEDVWSCDCAGNRNLSEHCLPLSLAGMSKLKMDEMVADDEPS